MLGEMFMDQKNSTDGFKIPVTNNNEPKEDVIDMADKVEDTESAPIDQAPVMEPDQPVEPTPEPAVPVPEPVTPTPEPMVPASKTDVEVLTQKNKNLKIWLTVLLVVLTAVVVGFGVYFSQSNKAQSDLEASQAQNAELQKQVAQQSATEASKQIDSLESQVADLTADNKTLSDQNDALVSQVNALNSYITELTTIATELKTTCGADCSSITIPPPPTNTSTEN